MVCKEDIDKIIKIIEKTTDEEKVKLNAAKTDNPEVNTDSTDFLYLISRNL